mgnify:CR=1 FL=1
MSTLFGDFPLPNLSPAAAGGEVDVRGVPTWAEAGGEQGRGGCRSRLARRTGQRVAPARRAEPAGPQRPRAGRRGGPDTGGRHEARQWLVGNDRAGLGRRRRR